MRWPPRSVSVQTRVLIAAPQLRIRKPYRRVAPETIARYERTPTVAKQWGVLLLQLQANAEQAHKPFDFGLLNPDHFFQSGVLEYVPGKLIDVDGCVSAAFHSANASFQATVVDHPISACS